MFVALMLVCSAVFSLWPTTEEIPYVGERFVGDLHVGSVAEHCGITPAMLIFLLFAATPGLPPFSQDKSTALPPCEEMLSLLRLVATVSLLLKRFNNTGVLPDVVQVSFDWSIPYFLSVGLDLEHTNIC
jgi:hypothetical protein